MEIEINTGDWVYIGENRISAVVCNILSEEKLEIVYLDSKQQAINEHIVLKNGMWVFENKNPCGGYSERSQRLELYVSILQEGRNRK